MSKTNNKNKCQERATTATLPPKRNETHSDHGSSVRSTASDLFFSNDLL